jgi:hypothetical protein
MTYSVQVMGSRRQELEVVIERGVGTFLEVGAALAEIKETRLYETTHSTFAAYCRERWGWGPNYAGKLIASATVAQRLAGTIVPTSETQVRPLTTLPPEQQLAAWQEAVETAETEGKPLTARHVQRAVRRASRNGVKRLPTKDRAKQFERLVHSLAVMAETLADLAAEITVPRAEWTESLRDTRRYLNSAITKLRNV